MSPARNDDSLTDGDFEAALAVTHALAATFDLRSLPCAARRADP